MNSVDFFKKDGYGKDWKGKKGVYCIEQPEFTKYTKYPIYKIGYARNSLYTRMGDYRTAYGIVPFKIHFLLEIPAGVFGKRSGYHLLTEQRIHKTLDLLGVNSAANEWYYDLSIITNLFYSIREELVQNIQHADNWKTYFPDIPKKTRIKKIKIIEEAAIKSKLYDGLMYKNRDDLRRGASYSGSYNM